MTGEQTDDQRPTRSSRLAVSFFVPGKPAPQGSKIPMLSRSTGKPFMKESSKSLSQWRAKVRAAAIHALADDADWKMDGTVNILVNFYMPRPESNKSVDHTIKPDIDKLLRAILDSLTGVLYKDDSQVVNVAASKVWSAASKSDGAYISVQYI